MLRVQTGCADHHGFAEPCADFGVIDRYFRPGKVDEDVSAGKGLIKGVGNCDTEITATGNVAGVISEPGMSSHFDRTGDFQSLCFGNQGNDTAAHTPGGPSHSNFDHF